MTDYARCAVCDEKLTESGVTGMVRRCWCPVCGEYVVSLQAADALYEGEWKSERHILSGCLVLASDNKAPLRLLTNSIPDIIAHAPVPRISELADRLLLRVAALAPSVFEPFDVQATERSRLFLRNAHELFMLFREVAAMGHLAVNASTPTSHNVTLTLRGWQRVEELRTGMPNSKQAFVAMWFNETLDEAWRDGFYPALKSVGFVPFRVDKKEHAGKIDDLIIAEIRQSGLLVADFTGGRGGVYFEAGFALGLGLPVIWTCKKGEPTELHFDTRQYNHIFWESPADLQEKLATRIRAVGPLPKA